MSRQTIQSVALAILAGLVTAGCAEYNPQKVDEFIRTPRSPVSGVEYRVYPPDGISIQSQGVPEINGTHRLRPDGKINLPLLGELFVAGMTPAEIEKALEVAASNYYEQVDATVQVTAYASQFYYVFGQVSGTGPKPWTGRDHLLDVLAKAQPSYLAWPERITVVRGDSPQVGGRTVTFASKYRWSGIQPEDPNNPRKKIMVNLYAMVKEGDLTNNILLMPNDVIYVQANPFAKIGLTLRSLLYPVSPIEQTISLPASAAGAAVVP